MRLTKRVRSGLRVLAGLVEAGGCSEIMGNDEDYLLPEQKRSWEDVLKAVQWINELPEEEQP